MKQKIKMLVFDLDGTLLNSNGKLSKYSLDILNKINVRKVIATSRTLNNCSCIGKSIGASDIVFSSGAGIINSNDDVEYHFLEWDNVKELIKEFEHNDPNIRILIKTSTASFSNYYTSFSQKIDINSFDCNNIEKITFESENFKKMLKITSKYSSFNTDYTRENKIVITDKHCGKANGILSLCQKYSINPKEVLIFGDDYNDISLFRTFENSVAVMNAVRQIKLLAKYICSNQDEDGVAKWLNTNYLNNQIISNVKKGSASDISIDEKKRIVTKTVSINNEGINNGYTKLFYEVKHMIDFNNRIYKIYPKVLTVNEQENKLVCEMEYLFDGNSLMDILKSKTISASYVNKSICFILKGLFKNVYKIKTGIIPNPKYIYDNYLDRANKRLLLGLDSSTTKKFKILPNIIKNGAIINGIYYPSYFKYIDYISKDLNLLNKLMIKFNTESHHDLIPSNIMIDCNSNSSYIHDFKLIDPRGELETGANNRHFMYDIGKLLFGISGFDLIRMMFEEKSPNIGNYSCYQKRNNIYDFSFSFNSNNQIVNKYQEAYDTIFTFFEETKYKYFNSLETIKNYELMFRLAESINFVADIPCRSNNGNDEKVMICFYLKALITISTFMKKAYGKDILMEVNANEYK